MSGFWTAVAVVLERFPPVERGIVWACRALRAARAERARRGAPHAQRHVWNRQHEPPTCLRCYTARTAETAREVCQGSVFFRRAAVL